MTLSALKKVDFLDKDSSRKIRHFDLIGKSCCVFGPNNRIRNFCKKIVEFYYFDSIVMGLISISTILLTLDNPLND